MNITTNYHWRSLMYGYDLPASAREDFDFIQDLDSASFIHYRGQYYAFCEIFRIDSVMRLHAPELNGWCAYQSDSFFSGIVIRFSDDDETYQIGTYTS